MAETKHISWNAYEHEHHERSSDWFWALGIIAIAGAITAVIFENILFAILIIVAAFAMALLAAKPPEQRTFSITERGIRIDNTLYPYHNLSAFWIIDEDGPGPKPPRVLVQTQQGLTPIIVIPLTDEISIDDVHTLLEKRLPEEPLQEPFSQRLLEFFGF